MELNVDPRGMPGAAFTVALRRNILFCGVLAILSFALFLSMGVPDLAWPNISSIALYATAFLAARRRLHGLAVTLVWIEVTLHAAVGTLLIGWESGFHYHLLMFVPMIVVASSSRLAPALLGCVFVSYLGLDVLSYFMGATKPVPTSLLSVIRWINAATIFAGLAYSAGCYRSAVRDAGLRLSFIATHDPLSGLWNRRQFCAMAEHELARRRRTGGRVTLAIVDVDKLLHFNESLGRQGGDGVIERVGHLVRRNCRLHDIVARWGEDEFICLLPDTDLGKAMTAGERLRHMVECATMHSSSGRCTVSIGITDIHADERMTDALPRAEHALRHSKREGGNRVRCIPARDLALSSSPMNRAAA